MDLADSGVRQVKQEIWANAHETPESISLILYGGCLGLSPVISSKIRSLNARRSLQSRKIHKKNPVFDFKVA